MATWPLETEEQERREMENTMAELRRIYCKDRRWTELNQEHVQRQAFVHKLLNFQVLPPSNKKHFRQVNVHESGGFYDAVTEGFILLGCDMSLGNQFPTFCRKSAFKTQESDRVL